MTDGERPDEPDEYDHLTDVLRDLVREGMTRHKLTQYRLAADTGLSAKHVSQLLNGKVDGSVDVWDRLLKAVRDGEEEE